MERLMCSRYLILIGSLIFLSFGQSAIAATAHPITIGIVEDVTGYNAEAGRAERDAAIMCIENWNSKGGIKGQKIEYVFRDNGGDPSKATTIAKELVNLGVTGVQGGTSTTVSLAEAAVLVRGQIPYMSCSVSSKLWDLKGQDGKWYAFSVIGSEPVCAEAWTEPIIKYVPNHKKVVIAYVNNIWGKNLKDTIINLIKGKYASEKMEVIDTIETELKLADASKEVTRIKSLNPDGVISIMFSEAYIAWFRACNDLNYHPPTTGYWGLLETVFLSSEPKFLYNSYGFGSYDGNKKGAAEMLEVFKKKYGYTPVSHWALGWDGVNILLTGINNVGTDKSALRDWIATKSKGMPLMSGNRRAVCRIEDGSPYFYSVPYAQDMGVVYVDKDGKQKWMD